MANKERCVWSNGSELYQQYHDAEWGVPLHDDDKLFEFLILEAFQAGLSWLTILNKREAFRAAFDGFDAVKIANYGEDKIQQLLQNKGIIRNRLKINAAIKNARVFLKIQKQYGSFDKYIWQFTKGQVIQNTFQDDKEIPATSNVSDAMSKQLKKDGFSFVGSTICYAYMQATGMVNDHVTRCFRYKECTEMQ
ncbi:DNA-3-methyladenine glycosylase I [Carboxylicivirga sediminis]|uniref:DNA-3-methyladenine glycosylase I n=1 Tax=Carboxylicivirga sediminis TaxID=2006564 RepID=A0A941F2X8_9BACT|nr:DNA-3-methyladenine glycosylase I [Carboxylicivirga sediminis]MBR8535821.1 DNA-3-methyladenine glycosylase I [Carboxylicivirga sediminis]